MPDSVMLGKDEQGFVRNARKDVSGRVRRRAKIKATASDGVENASTYGHRRAKRIIICVPWLFFSVLPVFIVQSRAQRK